MNRLIAILFVVALDASATTYWVSATGAAANLAACSGSTPLSGTDACSADQAADVVAGDIVYYRAGTYTSYFTCGPYPCFVYGVNSGTSGSKITFQPYNGETVIFQGDAASGASETAIWGSYVTGDYIIIRDFTVHNAANGVWIVGGNHNEVSGLTIYRDTTYPPLTFAIRGVYLGTATHNWIHNNTVHDLGATVEDVWVGQDGEGSEAIRIGGTADTSHHNTVNNNLLYHIGHALNDDYGKQNVWLNNIGHNEGWKTGTVIYGTATGGSAATLIDTTANFTALGVQVGWHIFANSATTNPYYSGTISAISTTTNPNDTITYTGILKPAYSNGVLYSVSPRVYAPDPGAPGNGKWGHRSYSLTNDSGTDLARYNLFEGNRGGHAAANPNNAGPEGLTLGSPGNIVRYNELFGSDASGIIFKVYAGSSVSYAGSNNRIYNNTLYKNGQSHSGNGANEPKCIAIYDSSALYSIGNKLKNNIFYQNGTTMCLRHGDYFGGTKANQTWANNMCDATDAALACTAGIPIFADTTMTDYSSLTLPNLSATFLDAPQVDGGANLALAVGAGSTSTTLVVDDALYFQDGSWGADISHGVVVFPDWIAIGTVTNTVQISAIDYTTNTITLASAKTWADGASIWLYKKSDGVVVLNGTAPDYGASEYIPVSSGFAGSVHGTIK